MCRHLAYVGPATSLRSLLIDPPHSLYRQAWAPRRQRYGTVNADGYGIGWFAAADPVPARYRRDVPIWGDPSLPDLARVTSSGAVLAAVRCATPGMAAGEAAAAPFASGSWLFSHNGVLRGWPESALAVCAALDAVPGAADGGGPPGARAGTAGPTPAPALRILLSLEAMVDSAFLWALVLDRLRAGSAMDGALAGTIAAVEAAGGAGRFNFLLTDGHSVAATACGDTLWYRLTDTAGPGPSAVVASEPSDDEPGWAEVPDRHVLTATPSAVELRPLAVPAHDRARTTVTPTTVTPRSLTQRP